MTEKDECEREWKINDAHLAAIKHSANVRLVAHEMLGLLRDYFAHCQTCAMPDPEKSGDMGVPCEQCQRAVEIFEKIEGKK